jgi:tRNA(fMet)-specific endonuclease VapC
LVILSLDTTVLIDLLRGHEKVRQHFLAAHEQGDQLFMSALALHELSYGAWKSQRPESKLAELDVLLQRVQVQPLEAGDALETGRLRAYLAVNGGPAGAYDELIAGQALARQWTVVTSNLRHFVRCPNLPLMDWRQDHREISAADRENLLLELMKARK